MCLLVEPVELQIDVDRPARPVPLAERRHECPVAGEPNSVGVQVDRPDRAVLCGIDELQDLPMDGGLPTGEHHHLGLSLARHEDVEHPLALRQVDGVPVGLVAGVGKTDRAVQIAAGVDLDDAQARVLLVFRAQPAVRRAAVADLGLEGQRDRAGLVEAGAVEVHPRVAVYQRLELAVFRAALTQVHLVVTEVDLSVDDDLAHGADRLRELDEHLIPVLLHGSHHSTPVCLGRPAWSNTVPREHMPPSQGPGQSVSPTAAPGPAAGPPPARTTRDSPARTDGHAGR